MNEVRASQLGGAPAQTTAAKATPTHQTQVSGEFRAAAGLDTAEVDAGAATEARLAAQAAQAAEKQKQQDIREVVAQINEFVQKEQRDLHFSVDDGTGTTVIRVLERNSGDLIRQIPEAVFLDLAKAFKEDQSVQLINVHG